MRFHLFAYRDRKGFVGRLIAAMSDLPNLGWLVSAPVEVLTRPGRCE